MASKNCVKVLEKRKRNVSSNSCWTSLKPLSRLEGRDPGSLWVSFAPKCKGLSWEAGGQEREREKKRSWLMFDNPRGPWTAWTHCELSYTAWLSLCAFTNKLCDVPRVLRLSTLQKVVLCQVILICKWVLKELYSVLIQVTAIQVERPGFTCYDGARAKNYRFFLLWRKKNHF